jgi:endonuclease/exonuclease/phosphatase family metal-dependent hydrolase
LNSSFARPVDRRFLLAIGLLALLAMVAVAMLAAPARSQAAGNSKVSVMTRNLYLGADLSPGIAAQNFNELKDAAGTILNQVDQNNFPVRAKGLAKEILQKRPALVGLQEAALWRTAPCGSPFIPPQATTVRYDFIQLLLNQLNRTGSNYRLVVSQPEFDFESPANTDHSPDHSCDINARLTMQDAILARDGSDVATRNPGAGHFDTLLQEPVSGVPVDVTRGWTKVDAKVGGSGWFRFVDTHLEAFDNQTSNHTNQNTDVGNGQVRLAQAQELVAPGGPARSQLPVVLVGDLNSDVKTALKPGDGKANQALLQNGFRERSTNDPLSCCLNTAVLKYPGGGGQVSDFDHKVDHIMTNDPHHVGLSDSAVTGLQPINGYWDSDHAGLFSTLLFH